MFGLIVVFRRFGRAFHRAIKDPESRGLALLALGLIAGGTVFYKVVEGFSWVDSIYFTVVTLTTVGYGDLSPETTLGKVFTVFYLLIGVGVLVAFLALIARHSVKNREDPPDSESQAS